MLDNCDNEFIVLVFVLVLVFPLFLSLFKNVFCRLARKPRIYREREGDVNPLNVWSLLHSPLGFDRKSCVLYKPSALLSKEAGLGKSQR